MSGFRSSKKMKFLKFGFLILMIFATTTTQPTMALSDALKKLYDRYQIYFYNEEQESNCVDFGDGEPLTGSERAEKVWNYIKGLGISGLSDRPEAIAGVLGNMSVESGFKPFIQNSAGCTGLIQWCKGRWNDGFFSYMRNKGFDSYYHTGAEPGIDDDIIDAGIKAELDFLFKDGSGGVTASNYIANLSVPQSKSGTAGARAYSDLFLVTVENAYGGSDSLEDPGVKGIAGHSTYQAASARRSRAETYYNMYGSGGGSSDDSGGSGGSTRYCKRSGGGENISDEDLNSLADYVKAWAWPTYQKGKTEKKPAYADYIATKATYKGDCSGVDCGAFVANIIKASGWDTSYPQDDTKTQLLWLPTHWKKVAVNSLQLGDVGIRSGHVILYVGNISGFGSRTASASQCDRAPMAGSPSENLNQYTWYRKK